MSKITVLDQYTIDKIAAGEVIERPASVVKELVENAIDAGATAVTVEIREGGTSYIRISDNGSGMEKEDVRVAFLRHSTSKIRSVEDLLSVTSLGFRGEALSSISAVAMVELITKTKEAQTGTRYVIEGGREKAFEAAAAPDGTTFLVRNLFYNTPARKKFLKSAMTEAGYVSDLVERLALSHPDISFQLVNNGQTKLHTSGNANLKDLIYQIYGRDIAANLIAVEGGTDGVQVKGFIGKPVISRGNRNYENYFINERYIKSSIVAKAIEDAYKTFMMQHKYPFTALHFTIRGELLDVNVHPTKMELRFSNQQDIYGFVYQTIREGLLHDELIPEVTLDTKPAEKPAGKTIPVQQEKKIFQAEVPELDRILETMGRAQAPQAPKTPLESRTLPKAEAPAEPQTPSEPASVQEHNLEYFLQEMRKRVTDSYEKEKEQKPEKPEGPPLLKEETNYRAEPEEPKKEKPGAAEQLELFQEKLLDPASRVRHRMIGQLFDTYWLIQFEDKLYIVDQHAAHEKVLYERTMKSLKTKEFTSQLVSPPIILTLSMQEAELLRRYEQEFVELGFEIEHFGGKEYALSAVPGNLFGIAERELFLEMLDGLSDLGGHGRADMLLEKIASMSCKAAVKGNHTLSASEADALIEELLTLENPYNCPHGRPTIISMTKYELEKKFKRIV